MTFDLEKVEPNQFWRYVGPPPGIHGSVHKVLRADVHEIITWEWVRHFDEKYQGHSWMGDQETFLKHFKLA